MERRKLLLASTPNLLVPVTGCLSNSNNKTKTNKDNDKSKNEEINKKEDDFRAAVFIIQAVIPVPDDATILSIKETEMFDLNTVKNGMSTAAKKREEFIEEYYDESHEHDYWIRDIHVVRIKNSNEYDNIRNEYDNLPRNDDSEEMPTGVYVRYEDEVYVIELVEEH
ncbi:hypothetical protein [Natronobacterium haloterrestre]|uniref:hypothetical protein n=1 Tax=Natronobacterium haloterrestre TaxID=148448 RepID=UPI0015A5F5F1|nr:hypothetical protein [Halobiforma haloterrestris]